MENLNTGDSGLEKERKPDIAFDRLVSAADSGRLNDSVFKTVDTAIKKGVLQAEGKVFTSDGKEAKIDGLEQVKKVGGWISDDLEPISKIFNIARDIVNRNEKHSFKNRFATREETDLKNKLTVSSGIFTIAIIVFVISLILFSVFKARFLFPIGLVSMGVSGISWFFKYRDSKRLFKFKEKQMFGIEDDMRELKVRLKAVLNDASYYDALAAAKDIPSFTTAFTSRVNYIRDLFREYDGLNPKDLDYKINYYNEIIQRLRELKSYELEVFDKYLNAKKEGI